MKTTNFRKIIALSLLISLLPAQSHAAWYDNIWTSIKANATAITSVAVGAAAIFGTMWFKNASAGTPATPPARPRPQPAVQPNAQIAALEKQIADLTKEKTSIANALDKTREDFSQLERANSQFSNENTTIKSQLGQIEILRKQNEQLQTAANAARSETRAMIAQAQAAEKDKAQWQASAEQLAQASSALKRTAETQFKAISKLETENAALRAELKKLEAQHIELAATHKQATSEYQTAKEIRSKTREATVKEIASLQQANQALTQQLAAANAEKERFKNLNTELIAKLRAPSKSADVPTLKVVATSAHRDAKASAPSASTAAPVSSATTATPANRRARRAEAKAARSTESLSAPAKSDEFAANNSAALPANTPLVVATAVASATAVATTQPENDVNAKADAENPQPAKQTSPMVRMQSFERSARGHIDRFRKLQAAEKTEKTLKSYKIILETLSQDANTLLTLSGIASNYQTRIAAIKANMNTLLTEIDSSLKQIADMQKSTESLQPIPVDDRESRIAQNTQALINASQKEAHSAFAMAQEQVASLEKKITAHLTSHAKLSDEASALNNAHTATRSIINQARDGIRVVSYLQDRWQPFANLERTFTTNLVADKYEAIDPKRAYEFIEIDSRYAAQINAHVLHDYIFNQVIPSVECLEPSETKAKKLALLRQIGGYIFSNNVMKETYDAFIQGDKALGELRNHGTQDEAIALLTRLQTLQLALSELEGNITTKISNLSKPKNENVSAAPTASTPRATAQPAGVLSIALSALGSAASSVAQRVGLSPSPVPTTAAPAEEPFISMTFARDGNHAILTDESGAPRVTNQRAVMAPPASEAQPTANSAQPMVRVATPMARQQDLSPEARALAAAQQSSGNAAAKK